MRVRRIGRALALVLFLGSLWSPPASALVTENALTTAGDTTDGTTYTTASITPAANALVLVNTTIIDSVGAGTVALSGNGLTYVEIGNRTQAATRRHQLFRAMGSAPTAGAVTLSITGNSGTNEFALWSIVEFGNVDTTGTNGSGAIVQTPVGNSGAALTSLTVTLAAFSDVNNATYGSFRINTTDTFVVGTGFTKLASANINDSVEGNQTMMTEWRVDNDTTVDASWTASVGANGWAAEIRAQVPERTKMGVGL